MKVILQQDVRGQGKRGQMIEASEGYARNFLLPRKLAIPATADAINTMNLKEKARKAEDARLKAEAEATAEKLKECKVQVTAKAGNGGRLFGAVTTKEISEGLKAQFGTGYSQTEDGSGRAHQGIRDLSDQGKTRLRCDGDCDCRRIRGGIIRR
jgi:large subunit ribosomal protein L9